MNALHIGAANDVAINPIHKMALTYTAAGLKVMPCQENKRPFLPGGVHNAFTDPEKVRAWFGNGECQIGIPCGANGLLVVQVDAEAVNPFRGYLRENNLELPPTYTTITEDGGREYYYRLNPEASYPDMLFPGVKLKGKGFVMAPPSKVRSRQDGSLKECTVLNTTKIASAPAWLAGQPSSLCSTPLSLAGERELEPDELDALLWYIHPNVRYEEQLRVVAAIHRATKGSQQGMNTAEGWLHILEKFAPGEVRSLWAAVGNQKECSSPSLAAIAEEYGADLVAIEERIRRRREAAAKPPQFKFKDLDLSDIAAMPCSGTPVPQPVVKGPLPPSINPSHDVLAQRVSQFRSAAVSAETAEPKLTQNYLIKGLLLRSTVAMLYGPSGTGKTFYALHLAHCIAGGKSFDGHKVHQGAVIYVSAEGTGSIQNRLVAIGEELSPNLIVLPLSIDLHSNDVDLSAISVLAKEIADRTGEVALIVIDTLARSFGGGDENAAAEMNKVLGRITALKQELNTTVLIVHHTGKDAERGARGSSALKAAIETELEIKRLEGGYVEVRVTKQRDLDSDWKHCMKIVPVTLGEDEDGEPVTSCRVEFVSRSSIRDEKLTGFAQKKVWELLSSFAAEDGTEVMEETGGKKLLVRKVDRQAFHRFAMSVPADVPEQQLNDRNIKENINRLVKRGIFGEAAGKIWVNG